MLTFFLLVIVAQTPGRFLTAASRAQRSRHSRNSTSVASILLKVQLKIMENDFEATNAIERRSTRIRRKPERYTSEKDLKTDVENALNTKKLGRLSLKDSPMMLEKYSSDIISPSSESNFPSSLRNKDTFEVATENEEGTPTKKFKRQSNAKVLSRRSKLRNSNALKNESLEEKIVLHDPSPLFYSLAQQGCKIDRVCDEFIDSFADNPSKSIYELIWLIFNAAGLCFVEQKNSCLDDEIEFADDCSDSLISLIEELKNNPLGGRSSKGEFLLDNKSKQGKFFAKNFSAFWKTLIIRSATSILSHENFLNNIFMWIGPMTTFNYRSFRVAATFACLSIISGLCYTYVDFKEKLATLASISASAKKAKKNTADSQSFATLKDFAMSHASSLFSVVFVHRYKDVDWRIRKECVAHLADWCLSSPDVFMESSVLRYLGCQLSDPKPEVRLAAIGCLSSLFASVECRLFLKLFFAKNTTKIMGLALRETNVRVQQAAIALLTDLCNVQYVSVDSLLPLQSLFFYPDEYVRTSSIRLMENFIREKHSLDTAGIVAFVLQQERPAQNEDAVETLIRRYSSYLKIDHVIEIIASDANAFEQKSSEATELCFQILQGFQKNNPKALGVSQINAFCQRIKDKPKLLTKSFLLYLNADSSDLLENYESVIEPDAVEVAKELALSSTDITVIETAVRFLTGLQSTALKVFTESTIAAFFTETVSDFCRRICIQREYEEIPKRLEASLALLTQTLSVYFIKADWLASFLADMCDFSRTTSFNHDALFFGLQALYRYCLFLKLQNLHEDHLRSLEIFDHVFRIFVSKNTEPSDNLIVLFHLYVDYLSSRDQLPDAFATTALLSFIQAESEYQQASSLSDSFSVPRFKKYLLVYGRILSLGYLDFSVVISDFIALGLCAIRDIMVFALFEHLLEFIFAKQLSVSSTEQSMQSFASGLSNAILKIFIVHHGHSDDLLQTINRCFDGAVSEFYGTNTFGDASYSVKSAQSVEVPFFASFHHDILQWAADRQSLNVVEYAIAYIKHVPVAAIDDLLITAHEMTKSPFSKQDSMVLDRYIKALQTKLKSASIRRRRQTSTKNIHADSEIDPYDASHNLASEAQNIVQSENQQASEAEDENPFVSSPVLDS